MDLTLLALMGIAAMVTGEQNPASIFYQKNRINEGTNI